MVALFLGVIILWIRAKGRYSFFRIVRKSRMATTIGEIAILNTLLVIMALVCFGAALLGMFSWVRELYSR